MVTTMTIGFTNTTMVKFYYPKNQHTYKVIADVRMKDPTTGEWKDAFLYVQIKDDGSTTGRYVRDKKDFLSKFQAVSN